MRVGISAFAADRGKSGISQYMANILGRLPELAPQDHFLVLIDVTDAVLVRTWHPRLEVITCPAWTAHPLLSIFWHLIGLPMVLRRHRCNAVFMPAGNRRLAWWYGVPSLGTVHDLSQLHVPQKYDRLRTFYVMRVLPLMMRRLTRVISVSESTRRDLEGYAGVDPHKIRVIPNGADLGRYFPRDRATAQGRSEARAWHSVPLRPLHRQTVASGQEPRAPAGGLRPAAGSDGPPSQTGSGGQPLERGGDHQGQGGGARAPGGRDLSMLCTHCLLRPDGTKISLVQREEAIMIGSYKYTRLAKNEAACLLVDHQSGLISLVQDFSPGEFKNNVLALAASVKYFNFRRSLLRVSRTVRTGPLCRN